MRRGEGGGVCVGGVVYARAPDVERVNKRRIVGRKWRVSGARQIYGVRAPLPPPITALFTELLPQFDRLWEGRPTNGLGAPTGKRKNRDTRGHSHVPNKHAPLSSEPTTQTNS